MNIISGQSVDLLIPFPLAETQRVFGWKHCYRTLSDDDDVPVEKEAFTASVLSLLPQSLSAGIVDKGQLTSQRHEAPLVGLVLFLPSGQRDGAIHFCAGRKAFKMGLVEEALSLFIPQIFEALPNLLRISALLDESNAPAKSLLKRLGWRFEGVTQDAVMAGGVPRGRVQFGLTRRMLVVPDVESVVEISQVGPEEEI
jgi:hypothetical protein